MDKRKTPLMGWSSWNAFQTDISEEKIKEQADALVGTGLAEAGYNFVNIDDGYFGGRNEKGELIFHADRFPNGLKPVVDYIHSRGLKAGIYSDGGDNTCAYYFGSEGPNGFGVGLYGHDEQDLELFFKDLGFDFIKVDWCGGMRLGLDEEERYSAIGGIIERLSEELDKDIVFNVCRWQFPGEWIVDVADSWRTGIDIVPEFDSVLFELDAAKPLNKYAGPGHVNDLDMLEVGNGMSPVEDKAHFAMWCMMSTPLMIGCDVTKIPDDLLELLKNPELIALNQDPACLQAFVVKNKLNESGDLLGEVWLKDLGEKDSSTKAVAFLNRGLEELEMELDLEEAGLSGIKSVRNLMTREDESPTDHIKVKLEPHGAAVFKIEAEEAMPVKNIDEQFEFIPFELNNIGMDEVQSIVDGGGMIVDVRAPDEYEVDHLEGAVNIPYFTGHTFSSDYTMDKGTPIILYCRTGRRSSQVYQILKRMGFENVYNLGGVDFSKKAE